MFKQIKTALPVLLGLALLGPLFLFKSPAQAANPTTINFQGKVVNSDGTNVTDGTYSFVFRIYNSSSPTMTTSCTSTASCLWEETQASVTVTSGVFQVELGSVCALTSGSCNNSAGGPINFSSNNALYLTMQFNGDTSGTHGGFMYPLIHITSVPFALQADNSASLGSIAAANYVQLATGNLQTDSTSNNSISINKTGVSGNILLLEANSKAALTVNNTGAVILGQAGGSGLAGVLTFQNSTDSSTATITFTGNTNANYTYQLPTGTVASNSCLQSGTVSGSNVPLVFGNCATGGSGYATIQDEGSSLATETTLNFIGNSVSCADNAGSSRTDCTVAPNLQNVYDNGGSSAGKILLSSTGGGIVLQNATSDALSTLFTIENNAQTFNYLSVTLASGVPHLEVFGASSSNYADIYYDASTSTAVFGASSGTTRIGTGTGNITFGMTDPANSESHSHTGSLAAGYTSTDYTFTRNLTGTTFALQGNILSILDTSSFTSGSSSPNLLYINQNNTGATGDLILAQTGGSTTEFSVTTSGNLTTAGTLTVQSSASITGALTVQSASGITIGTASNAGILALYNGANTVSIQGAGSTSAYTIILPGSAATAAGQCLTSTGASGTLQWLACGAGSTRTITLSPEYPGAVMTHNNNSANGSSGAMTSDFCSGSSHLGIPASSNPCSATQDFNYYTWAASSAATNDYDIWTTWQAPSDFSSISSITFYGWTTSTSDAVKLTVYNAGTACGNSTISAASTSFSSTTVSTSSCSGGSAIAAGSNVIFDVDLKSVNTTDYARVSNIVVVYNRN